MTKPREQVAGGHPRAVGGQVSFTYEVNMTCFTELRLSASTQHAAAYGLLGVAVNRAYVLQRWGAPVHYVRNHRDELIIGSFFHLLHSLTSNDPAAGNAPEGPADSLKYLGTFLKPMSSPNTDDFKFIDEHEWRVVQTNPQVQTGMIVQTGLSEPQYRLLVSPAELKLLVLPDDGTRSLAVADPRLSGLIFNHAHPVPLLTVEECSHF